MFLVSLWAFAVFLSAADRELPCPLTLSSSILLWVTVMMILRVYAMWNRSNSILCLLLFIYAVQTITTVLFIGTYNTPDTYFSGMSRAINWMQQHNLDRWPYSTFSSVTTVRVLDFSFCSASYVNVPPMLNMYPATPRFVLGAALIILAVFQTMKQSVELYKATKQWQPNRYMQQFVKDGIIYFLVYVPLPPRPRRSPLLCPTRPPPSTRTNTNDQDVFPLTF